MLRTSRGPSVRKKNIVYSITGEVKDEDDGRFGRRRQRVEDGAAGAPDQLAKPGDDLVAVQL